ncbi:MAG TPA: hypothetical protein VFN35_31515, partial [Ktedonobacteraceae bacterium]|nr:hypothetical protein [Ktedonobacteraceae bacterium]
ALRFAARLSLVEIAALMGKKTDAIRKQLTRLLQRLHRQYQQQDLEGCKTELRRPEKPAFLAVLLQIYAPPPPLVCITLQRLPVSWPQRVFEKR